MIVTPAKAGVQLKGTWIPAFAGMTNQYHAKLNRKIFILYFRDTILAGIKSSLP